MIVWLNGHIFEVPDGDDVVIKIDGKPNSIHAEQFNVDVHGNVGTYVNAGGNVKAVSVGIYVDAGGSVSVTGNVGGKVDAGGNVTLTGNVTGNVDAGGNVKVGGKVGGNIDAGGNVSRG